MRVIFTLLISVIIFQKQTNAQYYTVPPANASTLGNGSFLGPLANSTRTYQLLINENQLTGLVGQSINGISFRLLQSASAAWPATATSYTNYDIYVGPGILPANRNLSNFGSHFSGTKIQVRTGGLDIDVGSFPIGSNPNPFGTTISFDAPYVYNGGHLTVEIRHSTSGSTSTSTEALTSTASGYGTNFSSCWSSDIAANSGSSGNFAILRFSTVEVVPVKLVSFDALLQNNNAVLRWNTEEEINTSHFIIERSTDGREFTDIGSVPSSGIPGGSRQYNYSDPEVDRLNKQVIYYRLKMMDVDQRFTYSPVSIIHFNGKAAIVSLYPNPIKSNANIYLDASENELLSYRILNTAGQTVQSGIYKIVKGNNRFNLEASNLTAGQYYLQLEGIVTKSTISFIKQ